MAKLSPLRDSASRRVAGYSAGFIQSPCSRHTMCILVSARLQATAAPDAPAPTIRTSTLSSISVPLCVAPEWRLSRRSVFRKLLGWRRHPEPLLPAAHPQFVGRRLIERAETDGKLALHAAEQGRPAGWAEMAGDGGVFPGSRFTADRDVFRAPDRIGGDRRTALLAAGRAV